MIFRSRALLIAGLLVATTGCQKVDPQVLSLLSGGGGGATESDSRNGRITLGSTDGVQVSSDGQYKLKGRISSIEPASDPTPACNGGVCYKLKGTVRF